MEGLIHVYTGNGKGKTTAAIGLGVRASGSGLNVLMVQFLKSAHTSELIALQKLNNFKVYRSKDIKGFIWQMNEEQKKKLHEAVIDCYKHAINSVMDGSVDLLIMDEVLGTIKNGIISSEAIIAFLKQKPKKLEVVLTGRDAPPEIIEIADYVSEIMEIKHPMYKGVPARKGIEF